MTLFDLENAAEARFGEDNPNRGMGPVPNIGSTNVAELALVRSLRGAVATVREAGVTVSEDVDRVFGVMEALDRHQGAVTTPSIAGLSPDEAVKVLEEFALAKTRQAKTVAGGTVLMALAESPQRCLINVLRRDEVTGAHWLIASGGLPTNFCSYRRERSMHAER